MKHKLPERAVEVAAENTELTADEVDEVLTEFQNGLTQDLWKLLDWHYLPGGSAKFLVRDMDQNFWFALPISEFNSYADRQLDGGERIAIAIAHEEYFHDLGQVLEIPAPYTTRADPKELIPVQIATHEQFEWGTDFAVTACQRLLAYDLSPAEVLDYFVVCHQNWDKDDWIARRGVCREAVNKNIRSAKEKLDEEHLPPSEQTIHPAKNVRAVSAREYDDDVRKRVRPRDELYEDA